ncbi:hypothetical protein [Nocardia vaccinii]|uniref:hypothetical protein n=1 Tax=Nocardia vaccinii TaxID=1822 RepID=UPI000A72820D|nr:hypothetical protein [Nocardia vaccinii]
MVRNAHGTIHDVNQQYSPFSTGADAVSIRRYEYRYTLFSASGFTLEAQRYALAQQISLVDLSGRGSRELRKLVGGIADAMRALALRYEIGHFPVGQARTVLRRALETWTGSDLRGPSVRTDARDEWIADQVASRYETVEHLFSNLSSQWLPSSRLRTVTDDLYSERFGDLLVGFPSAPFILVLRSVSKTDFETYLDRYPGSQVPVRVEPAREGQHHGDWVIVPSEGGPQFRLDFALPELLREWLLDSHGPAAPRVADIQRDMLSSIVVFRGDRLLRLLYSTADSELAFREAGQPQ